MSDENQNIKNLETSAKNARRALEDLVRTKGEAAKKSKEYSDILNIVRNREDQITAARQRQAQAAEAARLAAKALAEEVEKHNKALNETKTTLDTIIPGLGSLTEAFQKNSEGVVDFSANLKNLADKAANASIASNAKLAKSFEEINVSLARQTGYSSALQKDVIELASSHDDLYLTMDDGIKIVGALSTGFKMFNAQSKAIRKETNDLAGRFQTLGVDAGAFSEAMDQLNDGFGLTTTGAISAMAEFENLAIRTGQPLSAVVNDFKDLGPQMARFGSDGVRVFTQLNQQARTLGLTTRQAFDISELFDTFESSADVAGKLNAQLGLQLNSVELMAASSEDRLKILRAEFDMRGMNMKDMGRRQKQMIAEILGQDVLTAEKLLGDPMAMRKFQREQANNADRIKEFNTAMTKFSQLAEQLFINIAPVFNYILEGLNGIAEMFNDIFSNKYVGTLISSLTIVGALMWKIWRVGEMFGKTMGAIMAKVAPFLAIFQALIDLSESFGYGDGADTSGQQKAWWRLGAGILGAIIGTFIGGPLGAAIGYGIGSLAGAGLGALMVDDAVDAGGFMHSAPGGAAAKPMVRGAAAPMAIQPGLRDRTTVSRKDGALDRMLKAQEESNRIARETQRSLANAGTQAIYMNDKLVGEVLKSASPI